MFTLSLRTIKQLSCGKTSLLKIQTCSYSEKMNKIKKVGFIGLGNMGSGMSKNLIKKGYEVIVHDLNPDLVKKAVAAGGKAASSGSDLASQADCIVTMLPTGDHVTELYTGPNGILKCVRKGTLLVDSSTIDPVVPQKLEPVFREHGALFIDAPVSGGVMAADNGTLTFMVGGSPDILSQASPVLHSMGAKVIHCGKIGSGQIAKVCNNMMLAISMAGLSEAMNLAISLGLDPKLMSSVINSSSGRSWSSEIYAPVPGTMDNVPSSRDYKPGFTSLMIHKDLKIAHEVAKRSDSLILLGKQALDVYGKICETEMGHKDFSIVYQFIKAKGNIK